MQGILGDFYLQVYVNLHPLNICISYQQTLRIIDKLSEDHDVKVKFWGGELIELVYKPPSLRGLCLK